MLRHEHIGFTNLVQPAGQSQAEREIGPFGPNRMDAHPSRTGIRVILTHICSTIVDSSLIS